MTPVPLRSVPRTTVEGWPGLTAASILTTAGRTPLTNSGGASMTALRRMMTSADYLSNFAHGCQRKSLLLLPYAESRRRVVCEIVGGQIVAPSRLPVKVLMRRTARPELQCRETASRDRISVPSWRPDGKEDALPRSVRPESPARGGYRPGVPDHGRIR